MSIMTRLEIDVMQASELEEASAFAFKYKIPALIIHQSLSSDGLIIRGRIGGQYKIITPVNWPNGEHLGIRKFRGMSTDSLEADGFEVMLTPNLSEIDTRKEASEISDFIRTRFQPGLEIRFVIGTSNCSSPDDISKISAGLTKIPLPTCVRNDIHTKNQTSKANPTVHTGVMDSILKSLRIPIKISGNITDLKSINGHDRASWFAVNLSQAKNIIKEFKEQRNE